MHLFADIANPFTLLRKELHPSLTWRFRFCCILILAHLRPFWFVHPGLRFHVGWAVRVRPAGLHMGCPGRHIPERGCGARRTKEAAERALTEMNGAEVGQWKVRCGWAHHKAEAAAQPLDPAAIDAADPTNDNVYIGNLSSEVRPSII